MSGAGQSADPTPKCGDCVHFEECAICFGDHEDDNACGEFARVTLAHAHLEGEG
jgi:hypothetical protein